MKQQAFAQAKFQELVSNAPVNNCSVLIHENGTLVDAGCTCPGGWSAAKLILEGLTGGQGQVGFAQRMVNGVQLPAVELFLDDPVGTAAHFSCGTDGLFGVYAEGSYALGVSLNGAAPTRSAQGNLVAAEAGSLLAGILSSAALIPDAVEALKAQGITDIQWAWSSCPIAMQPLNSAKSLRRDEGVVNVWVRGDKAAILAAVNGFSSGTLTVHELATACTYLRTL